jgi:hypothetical protein
VSNVYMSGDCTGDATVGEPAALASCSAIDTDDSSTDAPTPPQTMILKLLNHSTAATIYLISHRAVVGVAAGMILLHVFLLIPLFSWTLG